MKLQGIGQILTPYETIDDCPFFPALAEEEAKLEIYKEFQPGLKNLDEVTHVIIIYWLHKATRDQLQAENPHDNVIRGVFSMRGQHRPNPFGVSIVKIIDIKNNIIRIDGIDCLNGTVLLDIKPYDPSTEAITDARIDFWKEKTPAIQS